MKGDSVVTVGRGTKDPGAATSILGVPTQGLGLKGRQVVNQEAILLPVGPMQQALAGTGVTAFSFPGRRLLGTFLGSIVPVVRYLKSAPLFRNKYFCWDCSRSFLEIGQGSPQEGQQAIYRWGVQASPSPFLVRSLQAWVREMRDTMAWTSRSFPPLGK